VSNARPRGLFVFHVGYLFAQQHTRLQANNKDDAAAAAAAAAPLRQ
jgi:hypothetical protein